MNTERQPGTQTLSITTIEYTDPKKSERESIGVLPVVAGIASTEPILSKEPQAGIENKSTTPEPTESQLFWRKMFENGDQPLYDKNKGPIKFDAVKEVFANFGSKSIGEHIHAIDTDFRGGRDAGDLKERSQRAATLLGMIAVFTAFDWGTSKPWKLLTQKAFPVEGQGRTYKAKVEALNKIIEVMNDKYASVLGNMLVEKLTGKRGFIHEVADKGADTITVGVDGLDDWVNGPTLESAERILFQVPIVGALLEQGLTRLSMFQEKSPIHTATGKMLYMALGVYMRIHEVGKRKYDRRQKTFFNLIDTTSSYKGRTKPWGNGRVKK